MARRDGAFFFFFLTVALLSDQVGAAAACRGSDLVVAQLVTGRVIEGKLEYAVVVTNRCRCAQSKVVLRCYGLSSVELVDPISIRPIDSERCVLAGGHLIPRGTSIRFMYAWMTPQDFPLVSSRVHC